MKNFKTRAVYLVGLLAIVLAVFSISRYEPFPHSPVQEAEASTSDTLSGYAWSDNIGWVSFNCTDTNSCGTSNYGVTVNAITGNFSGFAWSDNIGWVSFNQTSGCPEGGCTTQPNVDKNTGAVIGWARACAGTVNGDCTGASRSDGWDGWIKLSGSWSPSVSFSGNSASGYSFGSDVVGWLSWSGTGYGVVSNTPLSNAPPTVTITSPVSDPSNIYTIDHVGFAGTAIDPNGDPITAYEWRDGNCSTGTLLSNQNSFDMSGFSVGTHIVYFRASDDKGAWSTNCPSRTINVTLPPPINGQGGSACGVSTGVKPTSGLCSVGTPSAVSPETGPGPWTWTCFGSNGGTDAFCSAATTCGNSICEPSKGETPTICRADCQVKFQEF
mgnify:CR=1 FL=1